MKYTNVELMNLLREHGYAVTMKRVRGHHTSAQIRELCYRHKIGDLPPYQYPHILKKHLSEGLLPAQIAELYSIDFGGIYRWMKIHKISVSVRAFTEEEDKYIRFNAGYVSVPEMAKHLRRTEKSIYYRLQKLNVKITAALGYTVAQLAEDLRVSQTTIRGWMRDHKLQRAAADGTYLIGIDQTYLHEWLLEGHIYRLPEIDPADHYLMGIKRECDEKYVSSLELSRIIPKWALTEKRGFPKRRHIIRGTGLGALWLRSDVYDYFWERRQLLDLNTIPADLPYWRDLCRAWDKQYIFRSEIQQYMDYLCHGPWYTYETKKHGFPPYVSSQGIRYYSRAAVLEWSIRKGMYPKLTQHLRETI